MRTPGVSRSRRACARALACVALYFAWAGFSAYADDAAMQMSRGWFFNERDGAALFVNACAGCHQSGAEGAIGAGAYPSLREDPNLASKDYLLTLLMSGRKAMPPMGRLLSDEQVVDVVNYVRSHFGNAFPDPISVPDVRSARASLGAPQ